MKLKIFVFLLFITLVTLSKSHAASEAPADANDPSSVWMAYCASFLPCKMVATQSDAHVAGASMIDRVKSYFSTFGKRPAMSASEFKEYLATLSPSERQEFVKRCTLHRGDSGKEICENDYLLDSELRALRNKRRTPDARSKFEQLKDERDRLVREDNRLHDELIQNCNKPEMHCTLYSGDSFNSSISRLKGEIDELNNNPEFRASFGRLESKAITWTKVSQEFRDLSLVPKPPVTAPKAWDALPSREVSKMQIEVNPTDKLADSGFKDPYSNVSSQLSQEKINQEAGSFKAVIDTVLAVTDAVAYSNHLPVAQSTNDSVDSVDEAEYQNSTKLDATQCEQLKQAVIETRVSPDASITTSQETVMFMTKTTIDMIDGGCPGGTPEQRREERHLRQQQYAAAKQACNAVQSGNRQCSAYNHYGKNYSFKENRASSNNGEERVAKECPTQNHGEVVQMEKRGDVIVSYDPVTGKYLCSPRRN